MQKKEKQSIIKELDSVAKIKSAVTKAKAHCKKKQVPLTVGRIICTLGITKQMWDKALNLQQGVCPKVAQEIAKVSEMCAVEMIEHCLANSTSASIPTFILSNYHNYDTNSHDSQSKHPQVVFLESNG